MEDGPLAVVDGRYFGGWCWWWVVLVMLVVLVVVEVMVVEVVVVVVMVVVVVVVVLEWGEGGAGYGCGGALWVKADEVHKSDMIALLKAGILPTFLCNTKNLIHYYLNQFYCSLPCET